MKRFGNEKKKTISSQKEKTRQEENSRLASQNTVRLEYHVHGEFHEDQEECFDLTFSKDNLKLEDEEVRKWKEEDDEFPKGEEKTRRELAFGFTEHSKIGVPSSWGIP